MNGQLLGSMGLSLVLWAGIAGCKQQQSNNTPGGQFPQAGTGVAGTGVAGTGVAGTGVAGVGTAGVGTAGVGTAGVGTAGVGTAGTGTAGTGTAGMDTGMAGTGTAGTGTAGTGMAGMDGMDPVQTCIAEAAAMGRSGACAECGCMKCLTEIDNCQDEACASVVACGQAAGCKGTQCYCGDIAVLDCALSGAQGPCMMEIAMASGVCDPQSPELCALDLSPIIDPMNEMYDPNNPVSRANAVSVCTRGQDYQAATAFTPERPEIMGMCETECNM